MVRRTIRLEDGTEVTPADLSPPSPRNAPRPASSGPSKRPAKAAQQKGNPAPADAVVDPIEAARGQSTRLGPILQATWPGSPRPYVAYNVGAGLAAAAWLAAARGRATGSAPDIEAADLLCGMVAIPKLTNQSWMSAFLEVLARFAPSPTQLPRIIEFNPTAKKLDPKTAKVEDFLLRWDAVALLAQASELRRETNPSHQSIGLRHIWAAALFTREGQRALQAMELLNEGLAPLVEALAETVAANRVRKYGDSAGAWQKVIERARAQPLLIAPARRARSGFTPDVAIDDTGPPGQAQQDPLGTRADATALADLILLEAAEPPLAIGLFGSWGSGKSTLIRRLKKEIKRQTDDEKEDRRLKRETSKAKQAQAATGSVDPQTRRVSNVAQLEFNAWSFIDSQNLWASLTSEIFEQLRAGGEEEWAKQAGRKLVQEVAAKVSVKEIAASAAKAAAQEKEAALTEAEADLQATVDARANTFREAAKTVLADAASPLPAPIAGALRKLFAGDFERNARGQLGKWRSVWSVWRNAQPKRFWLTLGLTALALVLTAAFAFPSVRSAVAGWWASVPGLGLVGALTLALGPLRTIAAAIDRYATTVDQKNRTFETEERQKRQAVETARTARDEAVATQSAATGAAAGLEETAKDPAKLLTYLLTESADIQTVRSHLGLLGTVRRCFQSLDDLIQQQRDRPNSIDRIVLYIDDLDRCSAAQVVQILEAVHLLLAFKCFVVVVAIDARWLRRSLEISHPQFKSIDPLHPDPKARADADLPSPSDYLEKIFQIPFWVQAMTTSPSGEGESSSAYTRYLGQLLGPPLADEAKDTDADAGGTVGGVANAFSFVPEPPAAADNLAEEPARAERVQLSRAERDLLDRLGPLAAKSPRAVKRLINIYRLIRARIAQDKETVFLTGGSPDTPSFAGVQLALALDSGLSAGAVPKVRAGIAAFSEEGWSILAADPKLLNGPAHIAFPAVMSHNPDHARFDALRQLLDDAGRREGFVAALEAVKEACGGRLDRNDIDRAFALTQRYSFRAT